jgi:hypothetical protein
MAAPLAGNKPSSFFGIHGRADVFLDGFGD